MIRDLPEQPALEAFALYFESPQVWVQDEQAKTDLTKRFQTAWDRLGTRDVPIAFRRDGFLIFQFDQSPTFSGGSIPAHTLNINVKIDREVIEAEEARNKLVYRRIEYMNAFLLALTSAVSTVQGMGASVQQPADPWNHLRAQHNGGFWNVTTADARYRPPYDVERPLMLKVETFEDAIEFMEACEDTFGEQSTLLLSMIYTACYQYRQHQFASAHMIGWCVVESFINVLWTKLINDVALDNAKSTGHTVINSKRRELLNSRDYTVSVITQILSLSQKIDDDMLARFNQARKVRNDFAHFLKPISQEDSGKSIRLATDLLTQLCGRRITSQLSYSAMV